MLHRYLAPAAAPIWQSCGQEALQGGAVQVVGLLGLAGSGQRCSCVSGSSSVAVGRASVDDLQVVSHRSHPPSLGQVLRSLGVDPDKARDRAMALASEASEVVERRSPGVPIRLSEVMNRGSRTMPVTEDLLTFTCTKCGLVLTADQATVGAEGEALVSSCPRDGARFATVGPRDIAFMDALITVQAAGAEVDWYDFMTATDRRGR